MLTVLCLLAIAAFIITLWHAVTGWCPLWVAVLVLTIMELLRCMPLGR